MLDNVICINCTRYESEIEKLRAQVEHWKREAQVWKRNYEAEENSCSTCGGTFGHHSLFCEA